MATTTRTGWTVDALTDLADGPAMIKELGDQVGNEIGAPAYTSTTRPTTGNYAGRLIFETDTGRVMRYPDSGSTWQVVSARLWRTYTPEWNDGPSGSPLSVGSGSIEGLYFQVGETVTYQVRLTRASDTNLGTTSWAFSVPVTPDDSNQPMGVGAVQRSGAALPFQVIGIGGTTIVLVAGAGGTSGSFGTRLGSGTGIKPGGAWASGDELFFGGTYRAATAV
jgi:hypothetical protein